MDSDISKNITTVKGNIKLNYKIFQWYLTTDCEYNCSYCFIHNINNKSNTKWYDKDALERLKFLNEKFSKNEKPVIYEFFGGEPLLHPQINELVKNVDSKYILFSNLEKFKELNSIISTNRKNLYAIFTSIHFQYNVLSTIEKIKNLVEQGIPVYVNIMIEPSISPDKILEVYFQLEEIIGTNGSYFLKTLHFGNKNKKFYENYDYSKFYNYIRPSQKIVIDDKEFCELDLIEKMPIFETKYVVCDMCNHFMAFIPTIHNNSKIIGTYKYCFSNQEKGLVDFDDSYFNNKKLCSNQICNQCDLKRGTKKGLFKTY